MKRNMIKTVEKIRGKGIIPNAYDLDSEEMQTIYKMFASGDIYEAISTAFDYGFILGARAEKSGKYAIQV